MTTYEPIRIGSDRLRVSRHLDTPDSAVIHLDPATHTPAARSIAACVEHLSDLGVTRITTGAIDDEATIVFRDAGFVVKERLRLLMLDLNTFDAWRGHRRPRRAVGTRDELRAAAVDDAAFPPARRIGRSGLHDAIHATPSHRFRILEDDRAGAGSPAGYLVCGRSGDAGYVQRLAVDPSQQRKGVATALMVDGLRWMRRHRVSRALVNTQLDNAAASALYAHLGFVDMANRLSVLVHTKGSTPT